MSGISDGWQMFKDQAFGATPDYEKIAQQQASEQKQNDFEAWYRNNSMAQVSPFGSTKPIYDEKSGQIIGRQTTLDPADQARLDANRQFGLGLLGQGQGLLGQQLNLNGMPGIGNWDVRGLQMPGSADQARNRAESALFSRASARLDPMFQKREDGLRNQLANQGLDPTSEAYKSAMGDFNMARNDAYSSAMNDAISGGGNEASRNFGMDAQRFGLGLNQLQSGFGMDLQRHNSALGDQQAAQQYGLNNLGMGLNILGATQVGMPGMPGFSAMGPTQAPNYLAAAGMQAQGDQAQNSSAWDLFTSPFQLASGAAQVGKGLAGK
jgi:hypothetical protein